MKKILFCIGQLFGGGAERVVSVWSHQLSEEGYDVNILVYGRSEREYEIDENVKIHTIVDDYSDYPKLNAVQRIYKIRMLLKKIKPDVVISFLQRMQVSIYLAGKGLRYKRIETIRNNPWKIIADSNIEQTIWLKCLKSSDAIIVQTESQLDFFSPETREKCVVIHNPISEKYLNNEKKHYKESINKFIAVGRLSEQKNYTLMLEAFKRASEKRPYISLDIYGSGSSAYTSMLKDLVNSLKIDTRVRFMGKRDNLEELLHEYDAFIMSSDFEGMPNALVEAMATGLVCIASDCLTGPRDLIESNSSGFLFPVGDINALANAIEMVSSISPERANEIGRNAYQSITEICGHENSRNKLIRLLQDI